MTEYNVGDEVTIFCGKNPQYVTRVSKVLKRYLLVENDDNKYRLKDSGALPNMGNYESHFLHKTIPEHHKEIAERLAKNKRQKLRLNFLQAREDEWRLQLESLRESLEHTELDVVAVDTKVLTDMLDCIQNPDWDIPDRYDTMSEEEFVKKANNE